MVNLEKWEEISWESIEAGDLIRMIREDGVRNFEYTSEAIAFDSQHKWWAMDGAWYATGEEDDYGYTKTFYRRKAKPFKLPTALGAVVEATEVRNGSTVRFVLADPSDKAISWVGPQGSWYTQEDILSARYKEPVVISKGAKEV